MERNRVDVDPDLTFNFEAAPDPDPTQSFTHVGESEKEMTFIHSGASLHCLIFLLSVIGVKNSSIFDIILIFSGKSII